MPDEYIELEVTTDETTLADDAIARLQDEWDTWEPNDGDLEVIMVETLAAMAASTAETAANVPRTILETIGLELFSVEPSEGEPAIGTLTVTFPDTGTYTIYADTEFDVDGYAFVADDDVTSTGNISVQVPVTAADVGTEYNGLTGQNVSALTAYSYISSVSLVDTTSGGADPDSDDDYLVKLLTELKLYGRTLVTLRDYELFALSYSDIGRAQAFNNGARAVAVFLIQPDGTLATSSRKLALDQAYDEAREVNTDVSVLDPEFGIVNVTYAVRAYGSYSVLDLITRINAKLLETLDPMNWGRPKFGDISTQLWVVDNYVRRSRIVDLIGDVEGVDYVNSVVLSGTKASDGSALVVPGTNQVNQLQFTGTITGGSYKLQIDGIKTATISYQAVASEIQTAIELLTNTEPGDVVVTGTYPTFSIRHTGAFFSRPRTVAVTDSTLAGGGSVAVTTTTAAVPGSGDLQLPLANGMFGLPQPGQMSGTVSQP